MKGVLFFHNFGLEAVTLCVGVLNCNFEKWEKQLRKGLPGFDRRKGSACRVRVKRTAEDF